MTFICAQMHEQNYNLFDIRHGHGPAVTHLQLKPSISKVPSVYIAGVDGRSGNGNISKDIFGENNPCGAVDRRFIEIPGKKTKIKVFCWSCSGSCRTAGIFAGPEQFGPAVRSCKKSCEQDALLIPTLESCQQNVRSNSTCTY